MNVILYSIEVSKSKLPWHRADAKNGINSLVSIDLLRNSQDAANYLEDIRTTWRELPHANLRLIRPAEALIGGFVKSNVSVFVFVQSHRALPPSAGEITLNVIAFSPIRIEEIFEISYKKLNEVFSKRRLKLLTNSHLLLFPFDKGQEDVFSATLKIRACLSRPTLLNKKDSLKLIFVLFATLALYVLDGAMATNSSLGKFALTLQNLLTMNKDGSDKFYPVLWGACLTYLILDFLLLRLCPWLVTRRGYAIQIDNLSSVIDDQDRPLNLVSQETGVPPLSRPPGA